MDNHWRGSNYGYEDNFLGGARVMVLGEAHYSDDIPIGEPVPEGFTRNVIEWYLSGGFQERRRETFFNRVERLLSRRLQRGLSSGERNDFWNSVIFYNYIPVIAAQKPNERPQDWMWEQDAPRAFRKVVKATEAEIILVCGTTLWRKKVFDVAIPDAYHAAGRGFEAHEVNWSGTYGAVAAHIPHPSGSRGWSYDRSLPVRDFLFEELRRRRNIRNEPPISLSITL